MAVRWLCVVLASLLSYPAFALADECGNEIDLTTFGEVRQHEQSSVWEDIHLEEVGFRDGVADRRFYISGMLGPSFANLVETAGSAKYSTQDTIMAAGGAMGIAFERRNGRLRVETEGMGRSTYFGPAESYDGLTVGFLTASNWSVMENLWRDVMFTDRFGAYGGGGIGAGGYRWGLGTRGVVNESEYYPKASSLFAWQAGGGLIYQVSDRLTFDAGYRYFQINPTVVGNVNLNFSASELMFSLRLYEPFRRWTR